MSGPASLKYFAREALRDIWDRRSVTVLSMATIAASLYIVGLFVLAVRSVEPLVRRWGDELSVSVFLGEAAGREQIEAVRRRIAASGKVRGFEFLDRPAALERFRRDFPDLADLPGALVENPFPASFEIRMKPESGSPAQIAEFAREMAPLEGVEDVRYDAVWLSRVRAVLRVAWVCGGVVGFVLLGAAVITISGVVRMGVYERRDEIEILRLVGANRAFIRAPFLIEGAMQGFAGALAALCGIAATFLLMTRWSGGPLSAGVLPDGLAGRFLAPLDAVVLLAGGSLLGLAGAALAGIREKRPA